MVVPGPEGVVCPSRESPSHSHSTILMSRSQQSTLASSGAEGVVRYDHVEGGR